MHNSLNYEEYTCWFKSGSNIFVYIPTYLVTFKYKRMQTVYSLIFGL